MKATWLDDNAPIASGTLDAEGVHAQTLSVDEAAYQPVIDALKCEHGYIAQDIVALTPDTENLDAICDKFKDEHLHTEDEVRFVLEGEGVFDIRTRGDRWMHIVVEPGDLIIVPEGRHHRFLLTEQKTIRCVRLFKDQSGWTPHYREDAR